MDSSTTFASPGRLLAAFACAAALLAGIFATAGTPTASAATPAKSGVIKGNPTNKRLATVFLSLLKAEDVPGLNRLFDPAFLLQRGDGSYLTKQEYLAEPAVVEQFQVSNIVGTRNKEGNVRVVRFDAETIQTIDGVPVPGGKIPRLSTFVKNKKGVWRLIAHANFLKPPVAT